MTRIQTKTKHLHQTGAIFSYMVRAKSAILRGMVVFTVVLVLTATLTAQVLYGTLNGTVTDSTGAALPGATVKALDVNKGLERTTTADSAGVYSFTDLLPGNYRLSISAPGFATTEQDNVMIQANTGSRVPVKMKVGAVGQEVTVTTAPPALQIDSASTGTNLSTEEVAELPTTSTTGRNFQSLYKLIPGSTPPAEQNSAGGNPQRAQAVNVNGISNATNTTRIDGAINAYPWLPYLVAYVPPPDSIESVNVVTGSFNAEQGAAGGSAINVITRSGTNRFHGSAWEYNSIAQFNAQAWSNRTGIRQKNIYNEVGGTFSGPIIKDKLFFFAAYNRVSVNKAINGTLSVPTAAMRAGNFAGTGTTIYDPATGTATGAGKTAFTGNTIQSNRFAPASVILLQNLPLPNYGAAGALTNNYFGSATNQFLRQDYDGKITYVPTARSSYFGRYSNSPDTINDPQVFGANPGGGTYDGGQPGAAYGRIQVVGLGFVHAFTNNFSTDWNAGYTRQLLGAQSQDLSLGDYGVNTLKIPGTNFNGLPLYGGIPGMYFTSYSSLGNANTGSPFQFRDNQYTGNANATWLKGAHAIRFGDEYLHDSINHEQPGSGSQSTPRGSFIFNGGATTVAGGSPNSTTAFADFLLGQADNYQKSVQTFNPEPLRWSTFAFYAQDTWRASQKLTVAYGVRYEYYPLAVGDHFGTVRYDPSIPTTVTDAYGTHTVGTVLVGGKGSTPFHANTKNGWGMIVPRFGATYQVTPKTVVSTGFGITVDPDTQRNLLQAYPAQVATSISGVNGYTPATSLNAGLLSPVTQVGIPALTLPSISSGVLPLPANLTTTTIPQNYRRGYIESYNLSIQQELPLQFVTKIVYVGTHSIRQQTSVDINPSGINGGSTTGRILNLQYGANTNNTDVGEILPFRGSVYNGLQAQLTRTAARHGSTGIIYTWSKAMDISDNSLLSGLTFAYPAFYNLNWAVAGYDRTNNFQWWTIYNLPFGAGQTYLQHGVLGYIVGNWRISTTLSRVSGTPFSITGNNSYLNSAGDTQLANYNPGVAKVVPKRTNNYGLVGSFQYVNPLAFSDITAANSSAPYIGNSGRNTVRGPGIFDLDTSIKRSFPIHDAIAVEFMAESFDVTNTPQFANPGTNSISNFNPAAATPSAQLNSFGIITTSNANRTLRLSAHVTF